MLKMHTLLTGWLYVDHRNGNTLDNQMHNLREATNAENARNQGSRGGTSPYKGVSWHPRTQKWQAQIMADSKNHFLGYFTDETDAARAYDAGALKWHGAFARLNFPPDWLPRSTATASSSSTGT